MLNTLCVEVKYSGRASLVLMPRQTFLTNNIIIVVVVVAIFVLNQPIIQEGDDGVTLRKCQYSKLYNSPMVG